MNFIVSESEVNSRLDKFLAEKLKTQSRSQIKKMIEAGFVLVNDRPTTVHRFLKVADKISLIEKKEEPKKITNTKKALAPKIEPSVIFENSDFMVLDKPAGLLVHPTERNETDTLVDWLLKKIPGIEKVGEQKYRAGIIHRLDKDVSGIMIVAKNNQAFEHLKDQFKKRKVQKQYIALVYGPVEQSEGEIDLPIGRNKEGQFVAHPKKGTDKLQDQDKLAKTQYKVLEYLKDYTLLEVKILTGRTHQIRAHLFAINHPILGDSIYKPKNKFLHFLRKKIKVVDPGRIFLHSQKIGFSDLLGQWLEFNSPLPKILQSYLDELKK
ncbi:MAG: RluA family pseudouridine synthase [Candidatus Buchananbacteria bacterium]